MVDIEGIRARWAKATAGPWAWRGNKDSKTIDLLSARSPWGDVVMDFQRWGFQGARPCFVVDGLIVKPDWLMGPPHHPWEIVGIDHPDAIAIAAAPADIAALLGEVERLRATLALIGKHAELPDQEHTWRTKRDAIRALVYAALGTDRITLAMTEGAYGVLEAREG